MDYGIFQWGVMLVVLTDQEIVEATPIVRRLIMKPNQFIILHGLMLLDIVIGYIMVSP